jgi:hypothetical protein
VDGVWTVVYLEPVGPKETRLITRMVGYTDDEESRKMYEFFKRGNQFVMDELKKKLSEKK